MDRTQFQKDLNNTYEMLAAQGLERRDRKGPAPGPDGKIYEAGISLDDLLVVVMMSAASEKATREVQAALVCLGFEYDQDVSKISDEGKLALYSDDAYVKASSAKSEATFSRLQALGQAGPKVRVFNPDTQKHELRRKPTTRAKDFWRMFRDGWNVKGRDMFGPYQKATPEERDAFWENWALQIKSVQAKLAGNGDALGYISSQIDESTGDERSDQALEAAQKDPEEQELQREFDAMDKLVADQVEASKALNGEPEEPAKPAKAGKAGKKATKKVARRRAS